MTNFVTFSDGTSIEIIRFNHGFDYIRNSEREFIEIIVNADVVPYELIRTINNNISNNSCVQHTTTLEDGSMTTIDYDNFIIPAGIITESSNTLNIVTLKLAKHTVTEEIQTSLKNANNDVQMALVELAQNYAELEERLRNLELNNSESTTTETEEV